MSVSRVALEVSAADDAALDVLVEAFWEALRDAGIDQNITVLSVERVEEDE